MNLGLPEVIIIIVIIIVLFVLFRAFGDKRYWKRSRNSGSSAGDKTGSGKTQA